MAEVERLKLKREVMLKLIKALIDGEELEKVSEIVSMDPNLSLRLLKFINSPYFGLSKEITSIVQAVAYLGYQNLKDYIFVLLTSSLLKSADRDEIRNILKQAFAMKYVAEKLLPAHVDEAFMVGLLAPVLKEVDVDELKKILQKAGVSDNIIMGLLDEGSSLYRIKEFTKKLLDFCERVARNEQVDLKDTEGLTFSDIDDICKKATKEAESLISAL
ncbi:HDOD domain-containing protein [Desulfurobacterium atlanticum]|uniref:EAL and modified HD-GYP domain-containing signal transduction protein n=1 Tax=Desulfurobacterium atlanticum TaxID=240169 RepID=A0A238Z7S7_9BACT|nr:HDOD domain-containing protein [Desulfurobacterium atlanticum]SNR79535.1 EAL and modified HD-GYP domain-containing signal transduction protein [Desulfurobacterium atlanticum]